MLYLYLKIIIEKVLHSFLRHPYASNFIPVASSNIPLYDFDLSLVMVFAAEDEGRTEEPTDRRRQKEREKGRVAKTQEIPAALVLIGGLSALFFLSGYVLSGLAGIMKKYLGTFNQMPNFDINSLVKLLMTLTYDVALIIGPVFAVVIVMAIVGNIAQVGLLFSLKPLEFDISRIKFSFDNLMKRVLFSKNIAVNLIKTIAKVVLMGWIAYFIISMDFLTIIKTGEMNVASSLRLLGLLGFKLTMIIAIILFLISIPDYFFQRYEFTESIKMTKQEIKEEFRESEGDPKVKQRQRQRAQEYARRSMISDVKQADVVITNPTHFAVALRYDQKIESAPRVLAKGEDQLAFIIRNIAKNEEIPIVENKPLARELYSQVEIGDIVPVEFYETLVRIFMNLNKFRNFSARAG